MKKNISINISGIIFHIEEDGYETLKKYLDSINRYFSSFEDNAEILADIESRIAEIFLSKLNEGKQVITSDDVQALITTMGSVSDFRAAEEPEDEPETSQQTNGGDQKKYDSKKYHAEKNFVRDQKRKILGGVCAGLARYLNIDAVWIRLLFTLLTVAWGITILIYIILWIAVPGSYELDEPATKKMFRNPNNKVLSGVAGGVAAYFGIDVTIVRILFIVFTLFFGTGLLIYLVLWMILPEAVTITDRMKMQGEPVTLSNIESNIKKGLNIREGEEENPLIKIILLPFKALAFVIAALGKIIMPLIEFLRVAIGILIILFGICLVLTVIIMTGAGIGLFTMPWLADHTEISFPLESIRNLIPFWMFLAAFFACFIPCLLIVLSGISVIQKRAIVSASLGWSMFIVFFTSIIILAFGIPQIVYSFKEEGSFKEEESFYLNGHTAVLKINEVGMDDYDGVELTLKGYHGKDFKLIKSFEAQGSTRQNAIENAHMIEYYVTLQYDSVLTFDSNIQFIKDAVFRGQRLDLTLYIPYHHPFVLEKNTNHLINQYINWKYADGYTWQMGESGLECLTCPQEETNEPEDSDLTNFSSVDISGKFDVEIRHGNTYSVTLNGPEEEQDDYTIYRSGETLVIEYKSKNSINFMLDDMDAREVHIDITMPVLERLEATGYGDIRFEKVSPTNDMLIELQGPINVRGEVYSHNLSINLVGKAHADLRGKINTLRVDAELASELEAYDLEVDEAEVEVSSGSTAKVTVEKSLEIEESTGGTVSRHGNANIIKR